MTPKRFMPVSELEELIADWLAMVPRGTFQEGSTYSKCCDALTSRVSTYAIEIPASVSAVAKARLEESETWWRNIGDELTPESVQWADRRILSHRAVDKGEAWAAAQVEREKAKLSDPVDDAKGKYIAGLNEALSYLKVRLSEGNPAEAVANIEAAILMERLGVSEAPVDDAKRKELVEWVYQKLPMDRVNHMEIAEEIVNKLWPKGGRDGE